MGATSTAANRAALDLVTTYSRLRRRLVDVAPDGLTPSQTSVLARLLKEGPATASDLAGAERVRPQSMAATLAALGDLVRRTPDPGDGRRQLVSLTDAGLEHARGTKAARRDWLARTLEEQCSEHELAVLQEALVVLARVVDG